MNPTKEQAIILRKAGYSYGMIKDKLGVSKSTLSSWLREIHFTPNSEVVEKIGEARLRSGLHNHNIKFENKARMELEAAKDIGSLSQRDLFMLGIGLYLGEGSKSQEEIRIVNSNPKILQIGMKWLREFGGAQLNHFRIAIHGYPDQNIDDLVSFWSGVLNLPREQFIKTSIDMRENKSNSKRRKLPYGTAHLYVKGGGTLPLGVKNLHRKIIGWIEAATNQV